jgi:hypothetical protein
MTTPGLGNWQRNLMNRIVVERRQHATSSSLSAMSGRLGI